MRPERRLRDEVCFGDKVYELYEDTSMMNETNRQIDYEGHKRPW